MALAKELDSLLKELVAASPEIEGAALAGTDGLIIASHLASETMDSTRIGASLAAVQGIGKRTLEALGQGDLKELSLSGSEGALYIFSANKAGILGIVAKSEANVGMINLLARDLVEKLSGMF